jgi:4-aminobutyrate aminotransferase-like enzyme
LVVGAGGHAIRFLPPLNVKDEEIEQAVNIVDTILSTFKPDEAST